MSLLAKFGLTLRIIVVGIVAFHMLGCAVYYRDRYTGAEHVWGFGHLAMKVSHPFDDKHALIQRTTLPGVAVGMDNGEWGMSVGWAQREHILIYDESTTISIQRPPSNDFFSFEIKAYPPESGQSYDTHTSHQYKEGHP